MSQIGRKGSTKQAADDTREHMTRNLITEAQSECAEHGSKNHVTPVFRAPSTLPFEHALRIAVPWSTSPAPGAPRFPGMHRYASETIFAGRVRYSTIHSWRFRHAPPDWAIDMLAQRLELEASQRLAAARLLRESKKPVPTRTGLKDR